MSSKINAIINADVKNDLRNLSLAHGAEGARDALKKIEELCIAQNNHRTQSSQHIKQMEMAMEIISECIFRENSGKSFKKKKNSVQSLSKIQELELLEMLCHYMSSSNDNCVSQVVKNAVYMFLFPPSHSHRSRLLVKLVSMAICTSNYQVLISTGILVQQIGCTSKFSTDIAEGLVTDYFVLLPQAMSKLADLPLHAPLFTANLLTSLSEMYNKSNIHENLLEVITTWVSQHPELCYTALVTNLSASLPNGAIPMPAMTPFVGLFKWCILAPFYSRSKLYSKLHLALLTSLLECKTYCMLSTQRNIISAESLCTIVSYLLILIKENDAKTSSLETEANFGEAKTSAPDEAKSHEASSRDSTKIAESKASLHDATKEAIHRLAQCVQVAMFTQTLYGNKTKLVGQLSVLPANKLMLCVLENMR
ncbi:hypothetical protein M8J75_009814 [Diaphorina citri]|nr:hypothetical protein M8J75_009814 [Diaphorina citri]